MSPLDLHVLGTPPAFVLSQDQTLPFNPYISRCFTLGIFASLSFFLRVSSLYRFQGSPAHSTAFARASLHRISKQKAFVKHFLALFSEKNKADQRFRTMRDPPLRMFGFWPFLKLADIILFGFYPQVSLSSVKTNPLPSDTAL